MFLYEVMNLSTKGIVKDSFILVLILEFGYFQAVARNLFLLDILVVPILLVVAHVVPVP